MSLVKKTFICVFGSSVWGFLTLFVWTAFLYGGQAGYVLLAFNLFGEMIFELFLISGIFILMLIFSFHILNDYEFENEKGSEEFETILNENLLQSFN